MFSETIAITIDGASQSLVRINQDKYASEYRFADVNAEVTLNIRNSRYQDKKRGVEIQRHNIELITKLVPATVGAKPTVRKAYFVFENEMGDQAASVKHALGLVGQLTSANLTKMGNFES